MFSRLRLMLLAVLFANCTCCADQREGQTVEELIQGLVNTSEIGYGYSTLFSGAQFLPYSDSDETHTLVLGSQRPERSATLTAIVARGASAIPSLVKHLDDGRKTKLPPLQGMMWMSFADEYDFNRRTRKTPPAGVNRETAGDANTPSTHTITVGDLCFVAIGQIVNRAFNATRYQPSGGLVVSSPTYSARLRSVLKADYGQFTTTEHRHRLVQDFLTPDHEDRRIGAYRRLALYYPDEVERLVLEQLNVPTYDVFKVEKFVRERLYPEKSPAGRKSMFDTFLKANGSPSRDGILLQLFGDLQLQESDEERRLSPPLKDRYDARSALVQLYGYGKNVKSGMEPYVATWETCQRARFVRSLTHEKSQKIGEVVRTFFLASADDDYFAPACLKCLASRGFGTFLIEQLNKIDLSRRETDRLHETYITAISISQEPEVRDKMLRIVKSTANDGYFMAAIPAVDRKQDQVVLQSARRILAGLAPDTDQGQLLLMMIGERFPSDAKSVYRNFLAAGSARRAETMCRVLWYSHPWSAEILAPLLDDNRSLSGFAIPMRVCDRAAQAISNGAPRREFDSDWGTAEKDRAIEKIKKYCAEKTKQPASIRLPTPPARKAKTPPGTMQSTETLESKYGGSTRVASAGAASCTRPIGRSESAMKTPVFWKALSVVAVLGLFYVGHGLHERATPTWDVISRVSAADQPTLPQAESWHQLWDGKSANWIVAARYKVPGGWLVAVRDGGITYCPDPQHEWEIVNPLAERRR